MTTPPVVPGLAAALSALQGEMPSVHKGKTARIPGKNGGAGYSYEYADLADVTAAVMPLLAKHGLAFSCVPARVDGGAYELRGVLLHSSGERLEGALPLQGRAAQELGSAITYARRYLLGAMTGVVTDDDDDGQRAQTAREPAQVDRRPAAAALWRKAQATTDLEYVQGVWREANGQGLLDVPVEHQDGHQEPLGAALRRYGDALAGQVHPAAADPATDGRQE